MDSPTHIVEYLNDFTYDKLIRGNVKSSLKSSHIIPVLCVHSDSYRVVLQMVRSGDYFSLVPQVRSGKLWCNNGYLFKRTTQFRLKELPNEEDMIEFMETEFYKKYPDVRMGYYTEDPLSDDVISMLMASPTSIGVTKNRLPVYKSVGFKEDEIGHGDFTGEISIRCSDCTLYIPYVDMSNDEYILIMSYTRRDFGDWEERFAFYWNRFCDYIYNTVSSVWYRLNERRYYETKKEEWQEGQ